MSKDNTSVNYKSDDTQRDHRDEENPRFGRGRRGNQEETGGSQDPSSDRKNDSSRGSNRESNRSDSDSGKNNKNDQENSETPTDENQDQLSNRGDNSDKRGDSENGSDGGGRDNNDSDEQFDEHQEEEEYERDEPDDEDCDKQDSDLNERDNSDHPRHDFSDHGDHSDHDHRLPPPDGPRSEVPSGRAGFLERASAYTITFSSETMFEVFLGSLLILVSTVFLFIYLAKRQRRKAMRNQYPVQTIQFVTPNQNIATSNFYQYYQKEGLIPTGKVVGYITEGQFLQPGAKKVENLKSFGRLPTQDEILDLS